MKKLTWLAIFLGAALAAFAPGCGDDDAGAGDGGTDTDADGDSDADADAGVNGDWCDQNEDCVSGFCETYQSVPQDPDGVCADGVPAGQIRIMGNLRDYFTGEYLVDHDVDVVGAVAALMNPTGVTPLVTMTTDADGRFEVTGGEELTGTSVGLVAIAEAEGYFLTITGMVEPELEGAYPPGIRNHDVKIVSQALVDEWSGYLESYAELDGQLPIGYAGAVVGSILHVASGAGVAGAQLVSQKEDSTALVYYLNEAEDGFNQDGTGGSGMFVIFKAAMAEKFDATIEGEIVSRLPATMGITANAIYNNTVQVEGLE